MATPSEILLKSKKSEKKDDDTATDKDKKAAGNKRNALIDFIAKHKKTDK